MMVSHCSTRRVLAERVPHAPMGGGGGGGAAAAIIALAIGVLLPTSPKIVKYKGYRV